MDITSVLSFVLACILGVLLLPAALLLLQVLAAGRPGRPAVPAAVPGARPTLAILVPAHNESAGIVPTLQALIAQLATGDRLLVVADNCSDDTAAVAAAQGAEVAVRHDANRRGKGYALDHGVQFLAAGARPDVLVIVDADCDVEPGALDALARACAQSGRPVQALYLMKAPAGAGLKVRISEFAWLVKNHVRALGYHRLGLPCHLTGSGMALPWKLLQGSTLATGSIVEDLQLGLDLAERGHPPLFCEAAVVTSVFPTQATGLQAQRTRWEHGHLELILTRGLPMFASAIRKRRPGVAAMALDLCIPPLASLVAALGIGLFIAAVFAGFTGHGAPLVVSAVALGLLTAAVLLARARFGQHLISFIDLLGVPMYVLSKIPAYLRFVRRRQTEWVRTDRSGKPPDSGT